MFSDIWEATKKVAYSFWDSLKAAWQKLKDFFGWSDGGTIFKARLTMLFGILTGIFGAIDWSPFMALDFSATSFSWKQVMGLGIVTFFKGLIDEIVRRYKATDL